MRTITLELLRHGPTHNQLLSPLTQYLALCQNHSAVTVRVPFEHNQMLYRLRALSYALGPEGRQFQVKDTAQVLGSLLAEIPGLTADMNRWQDDANSDPVTHLRLVLSASELALLPFELALAPNGFPGAGQPLCLQAQMPLCIMRETRRVAEEFDEWPDRPRILFVASTPPGYGAVPVEAHLLALRKALEPWIGFVETNDSDTRRRQVARYLSVLTHASIESIEEACATERFTHIHILAHGTQCPGDYDIRFGLALHDARDPLARADVVSGERLVSALRVSRRGEHGKLMRPAVVTLASCDSGNVGTVAGVGGSIAHALHEGGIPLVIASQFPLSFGGSVRMVETLYGGLLWGEDPRKVLIDLRRQLHAEFPNTHDWASVTAYASLSPGFEGQLTSAQIRRAKSSIDEALRVADEVTRRFCSRSAQRLKHSKPGTKLEQEQLLDNTRFQVVAAKQRLEKLLTRYPSERARIRGLLASTEKREAAVHYARRNIVPIEADQLVECREQALNALIRAREHYWDAFITNRENYWIIVQYLSLTIILQKSERLPKSVGDAERIPAALWTMAEMQSLCDLRSNGRLTRIWALGNLVELYILAPLTDHIAVQNDVPGLIDKASARAKDLVAVAGSDPFGIFSTRRQVARYLDWYNDLTGGSLKPIIPIAEAVFAQLPEREEPEWDY
ncbi:MAG: CHAT domain-containing protein [Nitrospiraceae bacterium]